MVKKSNVYTKSGDKGLTGLVGGTRISKSDSRIDLYGEVDELNSWVGLAISHLDRDIFDKEIGYLQRIQCFLFDLGSNFACEKEQREKFKLPQLKDEYLKEMEEIIDEMDGQCPKINYFILPGGSQGAATLHLCRTVCRKIERKLTLFNEHHKEELPEFSGVFINRLSDYFFVLAKFVNLKLKIEEIPWVPQK